MTSDERAPTEAALHQRYYQGTIVRVHPGSRSGWLRTRRGRDVPFAAAHLVLIGAANDFTDLRPDWRSGSISEEPHVGYA